MPTEPLTAFGDLPAEALVDKGWLSQVFGCSVGNIERSIGDGRLPQPFETPKGKRWTIRQLNRHFEHLESLSLTQAAKLRRIS